MKYRTKFVSNSSSTSFVIIGKKLKDSEENRKNILLKFFTIEELDKMCKQKYQMTFDEKNKECFMELYWDELEYKMEYSIVQLEYDDGDLLFGQKFDVEEYASTEVHDLTDLLIDLSTKIEGKLNLIVGSNPS